MTSDAIGISPMLDMTDDLDFSNPDAVIEHPPDDQARRDQVRSSGESS